MGLYSSKLLSLVQVSIAFTLAESSQDDLETQFYSYENFYNAFDALPKGLTLNSVQFRVHTTYRDDSRLSVCNILLAVRPELSKLTIITYKGKNFVKFDIKL